MTKREVFLKYAEHRHGIITISPRSLLKKNKPNSELIGFAGLMASLREIEERREKYQPLVWLLDEGDKTFKTEDSRAKWLNLQALRARFTALKFFDGSDFDGLYEWMTSRGVIIVFEPGESQIAPLLLRETPSEWEISAGWQKLYGNGENPAYVVFVNPFLSSDFMTTIAIADGEAEESIQKMPSLVKEVEAEIADIYTASVAFLEGEVLGNNHLNGPNFLQITECRRKGLNLYKIPNFIHRY